MLSISKCFTWPLYFFKDIEDESLWQTASFCNLLLERIKSQNKILNVTKKQVILGYLAGSVSRVCDFSSQGHEFKPHVGPRAYLNTHTHQVILEIFHKLPLEDKLKCYRNGLMVIVLNAMTSNSAIKKDFILKYHGPLCLSLSQTSYDTLGIKDSNSVSCPRQGLGIIN